MIIVDARGCILSATTNIDLLPSLALESFTSLPEACNQADGQVSIIISGGTAPYSYIWNNDPTLNTAVIDNFSAGVQQVLVTRFARLRSGL